MGHRFSSGEGGGEIPGHPPPLNETLFVECNCVGNVQDVIQLTPYLICVLLHNVKCYCYMLTFY